MIRSTRKYLLNLKYFELLFSACSGGYNKQQVLTYFTSPIIYKSNAIHANAPNRIPFFLLLPKTLTMAVVKINNL